MNALFRITEGWTDPLDTQLLINGAPFDATGVTLEVSLHDKNLNAVTSAAVSWRTQSTATVRLSPAPQTFVADSAPYTLKFKMTDGAGKVSFFPADDPAVITVKRP